MENEFEDNNLPEALNNAYKKSASEQFSVPESYFNNLSNRLLASMDSSTSKDLNVSRITPFKVPKDYFKNLDQKIIAQQYTVETYKHKAWYFSIAAVIIVLIGLGIISNSTTQVSNLDSVSQNVIRNTSYSNPFNELEREDLIAYAELQYLSILSVDELSDYVEYDAVKNIIPPQIVNNETFSNEEHASQQSTLEFENIDADVIEDYLEGEYDSDDLIEYY